MKNMTILMIAASLTVLMGCATKPVVIAPVGPNPALGAGLAPLGGLQVFSTRIGRSEGNNPSWFQHADYYIYTPQGKLLLHVHNAVGYYASTPSQVALPAGKYVVRSPANDYTWVEIPVAIKRGQTTRIHLDDHWIPPNGASNARLIKMPNGEPVGWGV